MRVLLLMLSIWLGFVNNAVSQENPKVLLLPFQLNDLTDLANAPEELKRIELLSQTTRESLDKALINVVAIPERATKLMQDHSPTYLFDHEEIAAELGKEAGADYVIVCVALKPTYLFVYPRTLLIDVRTKKVVKAGTV